MSDSQSETAKVTKYTDIDDMSLVRVQMTIVMALPTIPNRRMKGGTTCQNNVKNLSSLRIGICSSVLLMLSSTTKLLDMFRSGDDVITSMVSQPRLPQQVMQTDRTGGELYNTATTVWEGYI